MKATARTITVIAAALMIASVPVFAAEEVMGQQEQQDQNRECLLVAKNCPTDSIQERIQRIQGEINRGSDVYSSEELVRLNQDLKDAQRVLELEMTDSGVAIL
jgi:hypothetical protein